ncbi:hypothetical protein GCM10028791_24630 [Echinicola sediminis]
MKRFIGLFVIALVAIVILLFVTNPDLLNKVWLYIVGFIGYIVVLLEKGFTSVKEAFKRDKVPPEPATDVVPAPVNYQNDQVDSLEEKIRELEGKLEKEEKEGSPLGLGTITVLRYTDDGETTLGLLFLKNKFFAYTLEDTFREVKVRGSTRIPAGYYPLDFNRNLTPMTKAYRKSRPWFDFHLEIKDIPNFSGVYIHVGNTHEDTEGCLLIADGVNAGISKSITQSRLAFERFYKKVSELLKANEPVKINILNEDWFEKSKFFPA